MVRSRSRASRWLAKRLKTGLLRRKVSPLGGEYGEGAMGGKDAVLRKGGGTYIGQRVDLYRSSSRPI